MLVDWGEKNAILHDILKFNVTSTLSSMIANIDLKDLQLNALLEITQSINNNLSEEDLLRIYRFTLLADLKIQKLALFTEYHGKWNCRVCFGTVTPCSHIELDEEMLYLEEARKTRPDAGFESEFQQLFPVFHKKKLLAIVFVSTGEDSAVEYRFLHALTNIILVAIENKKLTRQQIAQESKLKELEIAKRIQNFLFPKSLPKMERLQIEAFYLPYRDVGGDYYDYIPINEHRFLVCIADVSGKGVPAALLMSNFQASLRTLVRHADNLKDMIFDLNHTTYISGNAENFITFFAAIYDFTTSTLEYINCGHNDVILSERDSEMVFLRDGATVLGMFDPLPFITTSKITGLSDFFLFAYTDGLTETRNEDNEPFEFERLRNFLSKEPSDLPHLHKRILNELKVFKGKQKFHDDITMLSCRILNQNTNA